MKLVDEDDDVRIVGQFLHDRLQAFFELTAVLRAGDDERDVEREDPLVGEEMRHVPVDDFLRQPFDDGGLANTGLADEDGVVLRAAAQHLLHAFELVLAPDQRIQVVLHRRLGEIAAELSKQRRFLHPRQRRLLVQQLHDVFAHGVQAHPLFHEDGRRDRPLFPQDAEQEVLGADVVVQQTVRLFGGELQYALGFRTERNFHRGGNLFAENGPAFDFFANVFEGQVRAREDAARKTFPFANQPKEKMLGLNGDAAELAGLVSGEEEYSPSPFGVPFEHPATYVKAERMGVTELVTTVYGIVPWFPTILSV